MSTLDKHHHPDIPLEKGMKILEMCTDELKRRLPIDFKGVRSPSFLARRIPADVVEQVLVKVITKDGIKTVDFDNNRIVKSA